MSDLDKKVNQAIKLLKIAEEDASNRGGGKLLIFNRLTKQNTSRLAPSNFVIAAAKTLT